MEENDWLWSKCRKQPLYVSEVALLGRTDFTEHSMIEEEAEFLLLNDINDIESNLQDTIIFGSKSSARRAVVVNMAFNLGISGFKKFKNTIKCINGAFYEKAAKEMLDSRWSKQVGYRAK